MIGKLKQRARVCFFWVLLTDLYKAAFDCIQYDLIIDKLQGYSLKVVITKGQTYSRRATEVNFTKDIGKF